MRAVPFELKYFLGFRAAERMILAVCEAELVEAR